MDRNRLRPERVAPTTSARSTSVGSIHQVLAALQAAGLWGLLTQGIGLRPQPMPLHTSRLEGRGEAPLVGAGT